MSETLFENKEANLAVAIPRMLGDADFELVMSRLAMNKDPILEVGPWLGAVTREFSKVAPVVVIDRFEWSENEAQSYPGIAKAAGSFRSAFETNLQNTEFDVTIIESDVREAVLPSNMKFGFCFYDGPREPEDIHYTLNQLSNCFAADGQILIKNVFGNRAPEVSAYVNALLGLQIVELLTTDQPNWCNIAVLKPGPNWSDLAKLDLKKLHQIAPIPATFSDPWYGHSTTMVRILWLASTGKWGPAIAMLQKLPHLTENQSAFDELENHFELSTKQPEMNAVFSVFKHIHQDHALQVQKPQGIGQSVEDRLRLIWGEVPNGLWQSGAIDVRAAFSERFEPLYREVVEPIDSIQGKSVAIVGPQNAELELMSIMAGAQTVTSVMLDSEVEAISAPKLKRTHFSTEDPLEFDIIFVNKTTYEDDQSPQIAETFNPQNKGIYIYRT